MAKLPSENILPTMRSKEKGFTRNSVKGGKDVPSLGRDVYLSQVSPDRQSATASQRQKLKTLRIGGIYEHYIKKESWTM